VAIVSNEGKILTRLLLQHSELLDARRKLLRCEQKEHEYLEELKEAHTLLATKEADCTRLAKDLGASQVREAQAEAKCVQETRRVEQQYALKVTNLENEVK
jgi:F0F1-type ATP synthase membrane subunit b/b'